MSSFSLRFGGFWWRFLAVDFGFFFGWGVGSAHCICLHWRRVRFGLHRERRRLREEIKKRTLLRHVSKRVLRDLVFNYSTTTKTPLFHSSRPRTVQLNRVIVELRVRGKTLLVRGKGRGGAFDAAGLWTNRKLCVSFYTAHVADMICFYFTCRRGCMYLVKLDDMLARVTSRVWNDVLKTRRLS